jgi:acetyltransferase
VGGLAGIVKFDVNPLLVDEHGVTALDARVVVRHVSPTTPEYAHMAIHPYPTKLVGEHTLMDGTRVTIRPIRPEDAALERDFVNGLSEQSRYLRFMYPLKQITPQMLSRFTQIDYDREMALITLVRTDRGEKQIAVARYVGYPDGLGCEFAIVVSDEWQGKGIATELLKRLVDIAKDRGLAIMEGLVLRENKDMLALAKDLGFTQRIDPDDAKLARVTKRL